MKYAPTQWKAELSSWRSVIQLNLVRSVLRIMDILNEEIGSHSPSGSSPVSYDVLPSRDSDDENDGSQSHLPESEMTSAPSSPLTQAHSVLALRLSPLRHVEHDLKKILGGGSSEIESSSAELYETPFANLSIPRVARRREEFGVRGWARALHVHSGREISSSDSRKPDVEESTDIIASLQDDMRALWTDEAVKELLRRKAVRIEDSAGL